MVESNPRGTDITKFTQQYRTRNEGDFPDVLELRLVKEWELKYGENPHQHAAIYTIDYIAGRNARTIAQLTNLLSVRSDGQGKGGLSLTNTMDITRAMDVLKFFTAPAVAIMKHNIVSGFAKQTSQQSLDALFKLARDADLRSNFGGTVVFNTHLDYITAEALFEIQGLIFDVVAAPSYGEGVIARIEKGRKDTRIAQYSALDRLSKFVGDDTHGLLSIKEMPTGRVGVQDVYLTAIRSVDDLILDPMVVDKEGAKHTIARNPTTQEADDLLTSWYLNIAGARSNGVVIVRNGVSVAMGSGQVERVGAVEQAIIKGMQKAMDREGIKYNPLLGILGSKQLRDNPFLGAVCSSDAFFPFGDSVETLGKVGVTAIVQPYGSVRDAESIDMANRYKIAMPATKERCFGHF